MQSHQPTIDFRTLKHNRSIGGDGDKSRLRLAHKEKGYDSQIIEHPISETDQENSVVRRQLAPGRGQSGQPDGLVRGDRRIQSAACRG